MEEKDELQQHQERMDKSQNLLNLMFAETFTRHSKLNESEFLDKIGFKDSGMDEKKAIRVAMFNVCMELANQFMNARQTFTTAKNILKLHLLGEDFEEKKGDK